MTHLIELNTNTTIEELLEIVGEKVPSATQVNLNEMCILGGVNDNSVFINTCLILSYCLGKRIH